MVVPILAVEMYDEYIFKFIPKRLELLCVCL